MTSKLAIFVLSYIGLFIATGLLLALVAIVMNPSLRTMMILIAFCVGFIILMFFFLQEKIIIFKPLANTPFVSKEELIQKIKTAFSDQAAQNNIFDVAEKKNKLFITWSREIKANQLINVSATGKKRIYALSFDEADKSIYIIMKDIDWNTNLGLLGGGLSYDFQNGLFAEYSSEYIPAFELQNGVAKFDLKKLTFNSNDMWQPLQKTVNACGWTIRSGMSRNRTVPWVMAIALTALVLTVAFTLPKDITTASYSDSISNYVDMDEATASALNEGYYRDFTEAVKKKDVSLFYHKMSPGFQQQFTEAEFYQKFQPYFEQHINLEVLYPNFPKKALITTNGPYMYISSDFFIKNSGTTYHMYLKCTYVYNREKTRIELFGFDLREDVVND